uniref:Protein RER1 n=1 Tax=Meloidogyne javanica TaxID=6303 RepID=A0A915M6L2_MELJA
MDDIRDQPGLCSRFFSSLGVQYQYYLDRLTPYTSIRWVIAVSLILIFVWRVIVLQGFYIVTYALFIYYLNLFLAFLTPKIDPAMEFDEDDEGPVLPKMLTCLTMKRQIMHMIRYRYIPFTTGKPRPKGKEDSGKVVIG